MGYGDYYPISNSERVFAILVMLGGVVFFSYIMGNFIDILSQYDKKMGNQDKSVELNGFLASLDRFSKNQPISSSLVNQIE